MPHPFASPEDAFDPDANDLLAALAGDEEAITCLINRYQPGARMSLHQDKDERDFDAPIVSVSLGLPAVSTTLEKRTVLMIPVFASRGVIWHVEAQPPLAAFQNSASQSVHSQSPMIAGTSPRSQCKDAFARLHAQR